MDKREKVMKGLECCLNGPMQCEKCPYKPDVGTSILPHCVRDLRKNAIELLKAQEPVRVGKKIKAGDVVLDFYPCGHCKNAIRKPWRYCPFCGRAVKWDE